MQIPPFFKENMKENLIKKAEHAVESINQASQTHDFSSTVHKQYDPTAQLSRKEKENILRLEPTRSIKVTCKTPLREERRRERDYMWEYVTGVFENRFSIGEAITVWNNPFPGDPCSEWIIPANKTISIPRWLARHLNTRSYVEFKFRERPIAKGMENQFMEVFEADKINHRTTFMQVDLY